MNWDDKRRFVLMEDGQEIDWVDPVGSFYETDTEWVVVNEYGVYPFNKRPNRTIKFQRLEWTDDE